MIEGILIVLLALLLTGVGILVFFQIKKTDSGGALASLGEKLALLDTLVRNTQESQLELRGLRERISTIEQNQNRSADQLGQSVQRINTELQQAMLELKQIETHAKARQELDQSTAESIRRLETVIAGTHTKGRAGENIVEVMFNNLPPEWQVRNFTVANKSVEFGLRLPSGCVLPIDSKWAATNLLEQFLSEEDPDRQQRLKKEMCEAVRKKAKEVKQY
ncbi:MAG TPA: DNA recombination protein RmuC, partial [Candidatus Omnitrophota bacterium]|nr:DNA recombination protein RmuC [Candidatus Omnitrophota bacterium]